MRCWRYSFFFSTLTEEIRNRPYQAHLSFPSPLQARRLDKGGGRFSAILNLIVITIFLITIQKSTETRIDIDEVVKWL